MPTIVQPTVVRAVREMAADKHIRRIGWWLLVLTMFCFSIVAGIYTKNEYVWLSVIAGICLVFALCILCILAEPIVSFSRYLWIWLRQGVDRERAWEICFPKRIPSYSSDSDGMHFTLLLTCTLLATPMFVSTFLFLQSPDVVHVVGNQTTLNKLRIGIPFAQSIHAISRSRKATIDADAKTADGVMVQGTVTMGFSTTKDEATLVRLANASPDADHLMEAQAKQELQSRFQSEISKLKLSELQSTLSIEYRTGQALDRNQLVAEGIQPEGKMEVSNLHPYFSR